MTKKGFSFSHYVGNQTVFLNELPGSRAARYQKEFSLIPMQSIEEFF